MFFDVNYYQISCAYASLVLNKYINRSLYNDSVFEYLYIYIIILYLSLDAQALLYYVFFCAVSLLTFTFLKVIENVLPFLPRLK